MRRAVGIAALILGCAVVLRDRAGHSAAVAADRFSIQLADMALQ